MRIVQAMAVSQPPPSAKPFTAAITGLPRFSIRARTRGPKVLDFSASTALTCASSLMSAPAMNALSPAPVRMTPRTAASSCASSNAALRSSHVLLFRALRTFGRLRVTQAMAPFLAYKIVSRFSSVVVVLINVSSLKLRLFVRHLIQKGAEACYGFADDEVLHLVGALVGVERFAVVEKASDLVVGHNA